MTVVAEYVTKDHFDRAMTRIEERFEAVDRKFEMMMDSILNILKTVQDIQRRVVNLENDMDEIKQSHFALEEAEGKDAIATINHERRITRLEKRLKIVPDTPFHLLQPE